MAIINKIQLPLPTISKNKSLVVVGKLKGFDEISNARKIAENIRDCFTSLEDNKANMSSKKYEGLRGKVLESLLYFKANNKRVNKFLSATKIPGVFEGQTFKSLKGEIQRPEALVNGENKMKVEQLSSVVNHIHVPKNNKNGVKTEVVKGLTSNSTGEYWF